MASLVDCLKNVELGEIGRAQITQRMNEYKKVDGLGVKDAQAKAVESYLNDMRKQYADFEARVAGEGGYIDPIDIFEARLRGDDIPDGTKPAPHVGAEMRPTGETTAETPAVTPEREAEVAEKTTVTPEDKKAAQDAAQDDLAQLPWRKGARVKLEMMVEDMKGTDVHDVLPFIEPGKDGKIGVAEIRKGIREMEDMEEKIRREVEGDVDLDEGQQGGFGVTTEEVEAKYAKALEDRLREFEMVGDASEAAKLKLIKDIEDINAARDRVLGSGGRITDEMSMKNVIKELMADMDAADKRRVAQLTYAYKKNGVSSNDAEARAVMEVMAKRFERNAKEADKKARAADDEARTNEQQNIIDGAVETAAGAKAGATGRAMRELETGSTKAGIGKAGLQSFLRSGTPISKGSDYTVQGRTLSQAYAGLDNFTDEGFANGVEVARAWAQTQKVEVLETRHRYDADGNRQSYTTKKYERWSDPIPFVAVEKTRLADRPGAPLQKGESGYYDPITDKSYAEFDNMLRARGEGEDITPPPVGDDVAPTIDPSIAALTADIRKSAGEGSDSLRKTLSLKRGKVEAEGASPERKASLAAANSFEVPEGYKLALMSTTIREDGKAKMRVLTPAQREAGGGVETLIGGADMSEWYVGYVPEKVKSGLRDARLFKQFTEADAGKPKEKIPNESQRPLPQSKLKEIEVDDEAVIAALGGPRKDGKPYTAADVERAIAKIEMMEWQKFVDGTDELIDRLRTFYGFLKKHAPNGIEHPVATREQAMADLETIWAHYSADEIAIGKNIIRSLAGDNAPVIRANPSPEDSPHYVNQQGGHFEDENAIYMPTAPDNQLPIETLITPKSAQLLHEVGHWAYRNILTYEDRLRFWEIMRENYYTKSQGKLDVRKLGKRIPGLWEPGLARTAGADALDTNELLSPQELFGYQFGMWGQQSRKLGLEDETFWRKVTAYVHAIFTRFMDRNRIDPDLEVLFSKIIPDRKESAKAAASKPVVPVEFKGKQSPYMVRNFVDLEEVEKNLDEAELLGDPVKYMESAKDLVVKLYSAAKFGAGHSAKDRRYFRQKAGEIGDIIAGDGSRYDIVGDGEVIDTVGDEVFYSSYKWVDAEGADTIIDMYRAEEIMAELQDYFSDDLRSVGHLTDVLDRAKDGLVHRMRVVETEAVFEPDLGLVPMSMTERAARLPDNNISKKFRQKQYGKKKRAQERTKAKAEEWQGGKKSDAKSSGEKITGIRTMADHSLVKLYEKFKGTKEEEAIFEEIVRRSKLELEVDTKKLPKTSKEFRTQVHQAKIDVLQEMMRDALDAAEGEKVATILYELQRRRYNKKHKNAKLKPIMNMMEVRVKKSVEIEKNDIAEGITEGIPDNATFTIREALSYITHRNPEVQATARTLAYRMFNLMGKTARGEMSRTNLLSMDDIHRLSGSSDPLSTATGMMADFTSAEFKKLRTDLRKLSVGLSRGDSSPFDLMHEIGHIIMRTNMISDQERGMIRQAFLDADDEIKQVMKRRNYGDISEQQKLEVQAEEWYVEHWAQYLAEREAKGDILKARADNSVEALEMKNGLERMYDRVVEGAAYMLNGLIGRKDIKQTFRRLMFYGDMFANRTARESASVRAPYVVPQRAADRFKSVWQASSISRKQRIRAFVGMQEPRMLFHATPGIHMFDGDGVVFNPSRDGNLGPGIYLSDDPVIVFEKYGRRAAPLAWVNLIKNSPRIADDAKIEAEMLGVGLSGVTEKISRKKLALREAEMFKGQSRANDYLSDEFGDANSASLETPEEMIIRLRDEIEELEAMEEGYLEALIEMGMDYNPGVLPVYARALNPFNARSTDLYSLEDSIARSLFRYAFNRMKDAGLDMTEINIMLSGVKARLEVGKMQGDHLYEAIAKALRVAGEEEFNAKAELNRFLAEQGYDSIQNIHYNTTPDGVRKGHNVTVLIDTVDEKGQFRSASYNIKHQDAKYFDNDDIRFRYSERWEEPVNVRIAKGMLHGQSLENDIPSLLQALEESGTPKGYVNAARSIFRGRNLTDKEFQDAQKASIYTVSLRSNSDRMRSNGMNYLANYVEEFSPTTQNDFASRYMPIARALGELPDAAGRMKRWLNRSNPLIDMEAQPASHERITQALRRGPTSRHYERLSLEERGVYEMVRDTLDRIHDEMVKEGAMVGHIKGYFPQVWNKEAIERNIDQFVERLENFFMTEKPSRNREQANKLARHVAANIIDDGGVYVPPPVTHAVGVADNLDFQRLINLQDYPGMYDIFEPFLQNNLDVMMVKYLDSATKRLHQTKHMGTNLHAYADYIEVGQTGLDGVARLLSHPRVFTKKIKGQTDFDTPDAPYDHGEISLEVPMPFTNEAQAREAVKRIYADFKENGAASAKQMMLELMPPDMLSKTYERRVDAIANAMRDFEIGDDGKPKRLHHDEFKFTEGTMRTIQGKNVNKDSSERAINASRSLRAFNNISLLTFTTLTSLPDAVLPLIRSGSFQDWLRGIQKYAMDEEYRHMIKATGVAIENQLHSRMVGLYAGDAAGKIGKAQNAFFNATMLTPWTDMWRGIAGSVGLQAFETMRRKALKAKKEGLDLPQQPGEYKNAYRILKRYGMESYLDDPAREFDPSNTDVSIGMIKFANDTIFSPNPNDIPLMWQTPLGSIIWQLKSFPLMMQRLAGDVLKDLRHGQLRRPAYLLAAAPVAGMGALAVKDVVQLRGGEDGREADLRIRNWDDGTNEQDLTKWWVEGMMAAGGFGFLAELFHNVAAQADNGAYGTVRTMSAVLGPSFGLAASGVTVAGGAKELVADQFGWGTSESNAKERAAAREIIGRIPMVGGVKAAREGMVDALAGPQQERGGGKKGGSSGWGKTLTKDFDNKF